MIELSKRLQKIASFVPQGSLVADVGTDHGYVPIYLVQAGVSKRALAMDVRKGPLQRAEEHIRACQLEEQVSTRLSDGLEKLQAGEADTVVIAGMGGSLMTRILEAGGHLRGSLRYYVLSPHSDPERVRRYLRKEGIQILREDMVEEEGKFYPVILAEDEGRGAAESVCPGEASPMLEVYDRYGRLMLAQNHPVLREFLNKQVRQLEEVRGRLQEANSEKAKERLAEVEEERSLLELALSLMDEAAGNAQEKKEETDDL